LQGGRRQLGRRGTRRGRRMTEDEVEERMKCPISAWNTGKEHMAQDCMGPECEWWMKASQRCAVRHRAHELSDH
jgi:hypothetical protein